MRHASRRIQKPHRRTALPAIAGVFLLALVVSLMGAGLLQQTVAEAATITVQVGQRPNGSSGNQYNAASVTINPGDTVTFIRFAGTHDVESVFVPVGASAFASPSPMQAGVSFSVAPTVPGTYTYYCTIHSDPTEATLAGIDASIAAGNMVGKIVVASVAPTATATSAPPTATNTSTPPTATVTPGGTIVPPTATPTGAPPTSTPTPGATSTPTTVPSATPTTPAATPTPPSTGGGSANTVQMIDFDFVPGTISVPAGTSVRWVNAGLKKHTATSTSGVFDSGLMVTGDAYSFTFNTAGSFPYICDLHPDMVGTVEVTAGSSSGGGSKPGGGTPTPAPTATPTPAAAPAPSGPAGPGTVKIIDYDYSPKNLAVTPGATVRWVNDGAKKHTVTANDGSYDSGLMSTGDAYSRTFATVGVYQYFCDLHPDMVGSVTVSEAATDGTGGTPWPTPAGIPSNLLYNEGWDPIAKQWTTRPVKYLTEITSGNGTLWATILSGVKAGTLTEVDLPQNIRDWVQAQYSRTGGPPASYFRPAPTPTAVPTPPPAPAVPGEVRMLDYSYDPATITVSAGSSVRFVNAGRAKHTVTAPDNSWDSGLMSTGDAYSHTFSAAGTYEYFCILHPEMTGTVLVTGPSGSAPPPPPAAAVPPTPRPAVPVAPSDVQLIDNDFSPRTITVNAGGSVRFINTGIAPHTVTDRAGSFDSGFLSRGDAYRRTFSTPGTFEIFCVIHPQMTGTVRVVDAAGNAPPPIAAAVQPTATAGASPSAQAAPGNVDAKMLDFSYEAATINVTPGTTVTWTNFGIAPHTVTDRAGGFDSGIVAKGGTFSRKFEKAGTYTYFCTLHPQMEGKVVVAEAGQTSTAAGARTAPESASGGSGAPATVAAAGDGTFKNVWVILWGGAALVALVAIPVSIKLGFKSS